LAFSIDPSRAERAWPLIAALEWCCRHGAAAAALLTEAPPAEPPWDRVLYDVVALAAIPPQPVLERLVPPHLPRPGGSAVERRLRAALRDTAELEGLFEDEQTLRLGPLGPTPRVDLLWRAGRVVVEIDGAEHERDPNYGADRHRDYELLVAGYLVLRLTNAEVELDLARALDKIRRVVNLRREVA
jgi:very-short-patch-repair endonuclease